MVHNSRQDNKGLLRDLEKLYDHARLPHNCWLPTRYAYCTPFDTSAQTTYLVLVNFQVRCVCNFLVTSKPEQENGKKKKPHNKDLPTIFWNFDLQVLGKDCP